MQNEIHVPYGQSVHDDMEIAAVVEVLKTSTQMGQHVFSFEEKVAQLFAKRFGIMVNSGSSANYLATEILQLPKNSEVITPILTFATTVAPLVKNHLIPTFIDVELDTYNIDIQQIETMITPQTRAMMIPNLLGNCPDWDALATIAKQYDLIIIEDSADTLGATLRGNSTGMHSDISTTSFYGNHIINCAGNGGMLCINDEELATRAKLLRSWGRMSSLYTESESIANRFTDAKLDDIDYDNKFIFSTIGYNLEPSEMGAAYGLVQLEKLANIKSIRQRWFQSHCEFFANYQQYFILPRQICELDTAWMSFPLTIKPSAPFTRQQLQIYCEQHHIQTRPIFTGNILRQPGFKNIPCKTNPNGYPHADTITQGGILLGCHHGLSQEQVNYMYEVLTTFFEKV